MKSWHQLIDANTGEVILAKLRVADTFWQRFRGLQFRRQIGDDEGLLLTPCRSIHTHWMRFAIDVAMLDDDGLVLDIFPGLKPWRIVPRVHRTSSIIETSAGCLTSRLRVGVRTKVIPACDNNHTMEMPC